MPSSDLRRDPLNKDNQESPANSRRRDHLCGTRSPFAIVTPSITPAAARAIGQ